ncbi:MAG: hypothetical protein Q9197_006555 [Variospora fuerteventurae]
MLTARQHAENPEAVVDALLTPETKGIQAHQNAQATVEIGEISADRFLAIKGCRIHPDIGWFAIWK